MPKGGQILLDLNVYPQPPSLLSRDNALLVISWQLGLSGQAGSCPHEGADPCLVVLLAGSSTACGPFQCSPRILPQGD
jgi:hypothetical protein